MDEILIEEKNYVSSKRAAQITGYAKDYIGQLCREGRVPARLVGRSWYVLESAIQDHRFGNKDIKTETTWESPRYEASPVEVVPETKAINLPVELVPEPEVVYAEPEEKEAPQDLQDSWRAWFDHVAETRSVEEVVSMPETQEETAQQTINVEEVAIPIHTIYDLPPEDLLPRHKIEDVRMPTILVEEGKEIKVKRVGGGTKGFRVVQLVGGVLAIIVATVAIAGTGYFDRYILWNSQMSSIAGVALYNK